MIAGTDLLQALPIPLYTTDAEGHITFYNEAAAAFWGHRPELGGCQWCGSWRLFWPDGQPLPHDQCPMAVTLREGREVRGVEAVAERPDGTRVPFMPYPTLLRDASGQITGAINLLVDISDRQHAKLQSERLAAIVTSSDDAIVSKTLDGKITSWNAAAERLLGYKEDEMIGQSITRIIPPELLQEEVEFVRKLQRGERIEHFDTIRVTKDGRRINLSLTVSPLRDSGGRVVGASKVARDITDRKRNDDLQRLLFDELNHRVKNTLATIQAIAAQSLRRAASPDDFVTSFNGRVQALARAHDLLVQEQMKGADVGEIVREQVVLGSADGTRISCSGPSLMLDTRTATQLGLVLHELATNARKYGALSVPTGALSVAWRMEQDSGRTLRLDWTESGVRSLKAPSSHGFGTTLIERTFEANGGEVTMRYGADGLTCRIIVPLPDGDQQDFSRHTAAIAEWDQPETARQQGWTSLRGRRVLLIEDEPLVAMETEAQLIGAGCTVIGPVGTLDGARRAIAEAEFDMALVDANLAGHPVHELAAALTQQGIPFAFATGYGRDGLPAGFQDAPILTKPFSERQLRTTLEALLVERTSSPDVVQLRPKRG